MNQYLLGVESQKDWISSEMVEKYLLTGLDIALGSVRVPLLSMMALGDVQLGRLGEIMFFI